MKKAIRIALLFAAMLVASRSCEAAEGGEVLWWLVDIGYENIEGTYSDGTTVTAKELGVNGARVRYEGTNGDYGWLPLFGLDENDKLVQYEGVNGVLLPAEYFGNLGGSLSDSSYSFVLELGNYDSGKWTGTSMESEKVNYADLVKNNHITQWYDDAPAYGTPWTPDNFMVVPEPNSAVMLLLGVSILALRRRRN